MANYAVREYDLTTKETKRFHLQGHSTLNPEASVASKWYVWKNKNTAQTRATQLAKWSKNPHGFEVVDLEDYGITCK